MGYQVPKHSSKRGWKVLHVSYKEGKRVYRGIPLTEYALLGIRLDMTREQVIRMLAPKNANEELARHETRRNRIAERLKIEDLVDEAFLPAHYVSDFEQTKLDFTKPKLRSYWKRAKAIIADARAWPKDWDDNLLRIFKAFTDRQMSPNYVRQVLPLLNSWGHYLAKKENTQFRDLPRMRGKWYKDVAEAFYKKEYKTGNKKSAPLTPSALEKQRSNLLPQHYRWLALSVWFGLRPSEVDQLRKKSGPSTWWVDEFDGAPVLWVYQTKLKGVAPEDRVKNIPAFRAEQQEALRYIKQPIQRPIRKTVVRWFGEAITLYGGRKGFESLMRSYDQDFEVVSQWLGHTTTTRTYTSYFNKKTVRWKKAA